MSEDWKYPSTREELDEQPDIERAVGAHLGTYGAATSLAKSHAIPIQVAYKAVRQVREVWKLEGEELTQVIIRQALIYQYEYGMEMGGKEGADLCIKALSKLITLEGYDKPQPVLVDHSHLVESALRNDPRVLLLRADIKERLNGTNTE